MIAVVQRVVGAKVVVDHQVVGTCGTGLLLMVAAHKDDSETDATKLADRIAKLRIFNDAEGKMNLALSDLPVSEEPQILAISNFTVYGETAKNRRPSFTDSAPYDRAKFLFELFVQNLKDSGLRVETGIFGADMQVTLTSDGPVTVIVEARPSGC